MKKYKLYIVALSGLLMTGSCKLDNYDAPSATLYGAFIDVERGGLVEQDIIRGTAIEYVEAGYAAKAKEYMVVKNDGTYRNTMLFPNQYQITPVRGNFAAVAPQEINVSGQTKLDFSVLPYIRVKELDIKKNGTKIVASFKLQQTISKPVSRVGIYVHPDMNVGASLHTALAEKAVNAAVDSNQVFTLELDMTATPSLTAGKPYFFRVGALIDVPEAKFNYAKAVRMTP